MARLASASPTRPTERRYSAVGVSSPSPPRAFNVRRPIAARGQARAGATGDEGGYHWAGIRPDRTQAGPAGRAPSNRTRVEEYNMCGYRVAPPRCRPRQEAPGVTHDPPRGCFQPLALVQSVLAPLAKSQQLLQPANEIDRCTDRKELTSSKVDKVSRLHVQSLFSYIRPGYIHSGYNRDHGGTTEPERSSNVKLKRTCHPVFVLYLTQNDLLGVG